MNETLFKKELIPKEFCNPVLYPLSRAILRFIFSCFCPAYLLTVATFHQQLIAQVPGRQTRGVLKSFATPAPRNLK
jgi:hypothetical protein